MRLDVRMIPNRNIKHNLEEEGNRRSEIAEQEDVNLFMLFFINNNINLAIDI